MRYFKIIDDGKIICIGTGIGGEEITQEEFLQIKTAIQNAPRSAPDADTGRFESYIMEDGHGGYGYERHDLPDLPPDDDLEISSDEFLNIISGEVIK